MQTLCQRFVMNLDCSITPNFCFRMPWAEYRHRLPYFTAFARSFILPVQLITQGRADRTRALRAPSAPDPPGGALVAAAALPLSSIATLITGELPKLVLVERLFSSVSSAIS